jgi:hypothetical protein
LHGFAKGVFGGGGFLRGRHRAIRTRRAWLPSEKLAVFARFAGAPRRISADSPGTVHSRADLLRNTHDPTSQVFLNLGLEDRCRTVLKSVLTQLWCTCGTCGTFVLAP